MIFSVELGAQCDIAPPDLGCNNIDYANECTGCAGQNGLALVPLYIDFPDQGPLEDYGIVLEYGNDTDGFQTWTDDFYSSGGTIQFVIDTTTVFYLTEVVCPNGDIDSTDLGDTVTIFVEPTPFFDAPGSVSACDSFQLPPITGQDVPADAAYFTQPNGMGQELAPGDWVSTSGFYYIFGQNGPCEGLTTFEVEILDCNPTCDIDIPDLYCSPLTLADTCEFCDDDAPGVTAPVYVDFPGQDPSETYTITGEAVTDGNLVTFITLGNYSSGDPIVFNTQDSFIFYLTEVECPDGSIDSTDLGDTVYVFVTRQPTFNQLGPLVEVCDSVGLPPIEGLFVPADAAYYTGPNGTGTQYQPGDWIDFSTTLYVYGTNGNCSGEIEFDIVIVNGSGNAAWTPPDFACIDQPGNEIILQPDNDFSGTWSGVGITDNGDGTAVFDPDAAGAGSVTYTIGGPCPVSNTQIIPLAQVTTEVLFSECDDNGTPDDPDDDFATLTVVVNGTGTGTTWTASDPSQTVGSFGDTAVFGPFPTSSTVSFSVNDDGPESNCSSFISFDSPPPCSTPACDITILPGTPFCNSNQTWFDSSDDLISQGLVISNGGNGGTFTANDPNNTTGQFGTTTVFGPYDTDGQDLTITITSDDDPSCSIEWTIPHTCNVDCQLEDVFIENVVCNDGGTPNDPTDDFVSFSAGAGGIDLSEDGYFITSNIGSILPVFGLYGDTTDFQTEIGNVNVPEFVVTFIDIDNPECTFDITVVPPDPCATDFVCDLSITELAPACDDNGTPNDPSDDTFSQFIFVSNGGLPGSFTADDPNNTSGALDEFVLFGPYTSPDDITFTVQIDADPSCTIDWTITNPCLDLCNITDAGLGSVTCNDFNSPTSPSDDFLEITLDPTGTGLSNSYIVTAATVSVSPGQGTYGTPSNQNLLGAATAPDPVILTITDFDDPTCSITVEVPNITPCSDECAIDADYINVLPCDNNGTPADPTDDLFSFEIAVSGNSTGPGWTADDPLATAGNYTDTTIFGPYLIADGDITVTIADNDDPNCTDQFTVSAPQSCSSVDCQIDLPTISAVNCVNNGTPNNAADDQVEFTLVFTGTNLSANGYNISSNAGPIIPANGDYDIPTTFTAPAGTAGAGNLAVTVTDADDPGCSVEFTVTDPGICSVPCVITLQVFDIVCDDNGTPSDPSDDVFTAAIGVSGSSGDTWVATDPNITTGDYGTVTEFGPYPISGGTVTINFADAIVSGCEASVDIDPPATCSDDCGIFPTLIDLQCNDNGTDGISSDDFYEAVIIVDSSNSSNFWTLTAPVNVIAPYGQQTTIGPLNLNNTIFLNLEDSIDPTCSAILEITASGGCSDGCQQSDSTFLFDETCDPALAGIESLFFINSLGCDSVVIVETVLLQSDTTIFNGVSCNPADTGTVRSFLVNQFGCDSLVLQVTTLLPSDTTFLSNTSCNPADTGIQVTTLSNINGCDSVIISTISFSSSDSTIVTAVSCDPADTSTVSEVFSNIDGCDSVVITQTLLEESDTTFITSFTCNPADTATSSEVFTNVAGCDSVIITAVLLQASDTTLITSSTCDPADTLTTFEILVNASGCDSVVIRQISLANSDTTLLETFTCDPADTVTTIDILSNTSGCDSVIISSVLLLPTDTTTNQIITCDPADTSSTVDVLTNVQGCDSVVITEVILSSEDTTIVNTTSCDPSDTSTTISIFTNTLGCDSIVVTNTTLGSSDTTFISDSSCNIQDTGITELVLTNAAGCDSVLITEVLFTPGDTTLINSILCPEDSLVINNTRYDLDNPAGLEVLTGTGGCDSILIIELIFEEVPVQQDIDSLLCPGDFVVINGTIYDQDNSSGVEVVPAINSNCDSLVINIELQYDTLNAFATALSPICQGNNGSLRIDSISGGLPPYNVIIEGDSIYTISTTPALIEGLAVGPVSFIVVDSRACSDFGSTEIQEGSEVNIVLDSIITVEAGQSITLQPDIDFDYDNIIWQPDNGLSCIDCENPVFNGQSDAVITVSAFSNGGCSASASVTIQVERTSELFAPNVFSPNNDGINDGFTVFSTDPEAIIDRMLIYDRWGNLMWEDIEFPASNPADGWDGRFNDNVVNPGVYMFVAEVTTSDGEMTTVSGDVTVVR